MIRMLSKRERIILYTTIGVIISAIAFNFIIAPVLTKINYLNNEIKVSRMKLTKYHWLLTQKDNTQNKYSKFSADIAVLGEQKDTSVSALSEIENLAKNADIRIIDIRPQTNSIDLKAEGTMEGYLKFIYNIESSLLLLRIKKFQLSTKPNSPTLEGAFSISKLSGID